MNCRIYAAVCLIFCLTSICAAQSPDARPHFEVASVKRNLSGCANGRGGNAAPPPGRLRVSCIAVKDLIQAAYGTFANGPTPAPFVPDVAGAPDWVDTDLYDVDAVPSGPATIDRMYGPMMQTLLEERFGLRIRREARERSVYLLSVAPGGARLKPTAPGSCVLFDPTHPPEQPRQGQPPPALCGRGSYQLNGVRMSVEAYGVSMAQFAGLTLGRAELGRPVIDRTGLAGQFDIHFEFRSDLGVPLDGSEPQDSPGSIFSAMRELGLKLAAGKAPVDVLVVERINRPTEN
ncbi:MAG TPA: TIGR03435 family protein [Bryobacteraceae bacterium]|nr:TIGR03435 family protein [Bryobacteraceae bacterium]